MDLRTRDASGYEASSQDEKVESRLTSRSQASTAYSACFEDQGGSANIALSKLYFNWSIIATKLPRSTLFRISDSLSKRIQSGNSSIRGRLMITHALHFLGSTYCPRRIVVLLRTILHFIGILTRLFGSVCCLIRRGFQVPVIIP
jgi:hypothetical protein